MPLRTGLFAYYSQGEASGDALDSVGGAYHLTAVNNPGTATGRVGNARDYAPASSQAHYGPSLGTIFAMGDRDWGVSLWFKLRSAPAAGASYVLVGKDTASGNREYVLEVYNNAGTVNLRFYVCSGGGTNTIHMATFTAIALGTGNWYNATAWHDATNNQVGVCLNAMTPATTSTGGAAPNSNTSVSPYIGARSYAGLPGYFDGQIDEVAFWLKVPSANEREDLFNDGLGLAYSELATPDAPYATMTTSLAAWWALDEASGNATDSTANAYTLTDNNAVGTTTAKVGAGARSFNGTNQSLTRASSSGLVVGTDPFTWAGWVKLNNTTATHVFAGKTDGSTAAGSEWQVYFNATTDVPTLVGYQGSSSVTLASATVLGTGTWYFLVAAYEPANSLTQISVNGVTTYGALSGGVNATSSTFEMGGKGSNWLNGALDECALWLRRLKPWERRWLYNGGVGRSYAQANVKLLDGLQAYWALDEPSGNAIDSHTNAITLTDNNTVTSSTGILNTARTFASSSTEYLDCADNAALSFGDEGMTVVAWAYATEVSSPHGLFGKWGSAGTDAQLEYCLRLFSGLWRLELGNGTTKTNMSHATGPTGSTWNMVAVMHDPAANLVGVSVNAGAFTTAAWSTGVFNGPARFALGRPGEFAGQYWDGRIDEVGVWRRVLTAADLAVLYGNGTPPGYASFTATPAAGGVGLSGYYYRHLLGAA